MAYAADCGGMEIYMYEYTWYQWLTFFFIYCFFGWIFESAYVSAKSRRFVNRGFLRLPLLPLYGTGAVMMLWVSLPVKDSLFLVYVFGVIAATLLEYVTGWGMERLFKMKYWDYSSQRFNLKGYICLSSSMAWGFLTILLTEIIHRPIERYVLGLPVMVNMVCVAVTVILFAIDAAESVKAALDLAKVLDAMTSIRAELDDIQVQMALLKAETSDRVADARDEAAARLNRMKSDAASHAYALKDDTAERLNELVENTVEKMNGLMEETAGRVGGLVGNTAEKVAGLVENTAERVARTAERLSELTEDAAARVTTSLVQHAEGSHPKDQGEDRSEDRGKEITGDGDRHPAHRASREPDGYAAQERGDRLAALSRRLASITEKRHAIFSHINFYHRSLLKGNPTASSSRFAEALKELREMADRKKMS